MDPPAAAVDLSTGEERDRSAAPRPIHYTDPARPRPACEVLRHAGERVEGREAAPSRRRESGGRECGAWEGDIESERAAPAWERVRETERGAGRATRDFTRE
jgi:hypothetical protein